MTKNEKKNNIIFDKKIDDVINTLSISLTFIFIGILLYFELIKIGNNIVSTIVQWIFIIIGILMITTGFKKNENNNYNIKGFDSLGIGITFMIIWYFIKNLTFFLFVIIAIIVLIIGTYGTIRGILEISYSLKLNLKSKDSKNTKKFIKDLILFLTKIATLVLTLLNIIKTINTIN